MDIWCCLSSSCMHTMTDDLEQQNTATQLQQRKTSSHLSSTAVWNIELSEEEEHYHRELYPSNPR
jgi:hypothetical protein